MIWFFYGWGGIGKQSIFVSYIPFYRQRPIDAVLKGPKLNDLNTTHEFEPGDSALNMIRLNEMPEELVSRSDDLIIELHYIWCNAGPFQFRHFLAISSAFRRFRPQVVHFHTAHLPQSAPHILEWYEDIKRTIPFLELHEVSEASCVTNQMPNFDYLNQILKESNRRHVIVQEDVVVNSHFRQRLHSKDDDVFVVSKATAEYLWTQYKKNNSKFILSQCLSVTFLSLAENCVQNVSPFSICDKDLINEDICIHFTSNIFVRDIPKSSVSLALFIRYNYYGSSQIILPKLYDHDVIPKVGHYVYLGNEQVTEKQLDFEFYMSILSLLGIVKLDCVYIHGTVKFTGKFWDDLMKRNLCVRWHYWPFPGHVWQRQQTGRIEHIADMIRTQIFLQYGGLHMDPDAFFHRPLPDHYWRYEAIIAEDGHLICPGFEQMPKDIRSQLNLGICLSMPGSRYFAKYQEAQKHYHGNLWTYNSGEKPLQIYERNPNLAHLDSRLQVVCAGGKCCPSWAITEEEAHRLSQDVNKWLNCTYAVHTVWPSIGELSNPSSIRNSNSIFGRIAALILASNNITVTEVEKL